MRIGIYCKDGISDLVNLLSPRLLKADHIFNTEKMSPISLKKQTKSIKMITKFESKQQKSIVHIHYILFTELTHRLCL